MRTATHFYRSSVGKKILVALTGIVLYGFVVVHMIGNLKVFLGREHFDAYARFLREVGEPALAHGQALWLFRIVLLGAVGVHLLLTWQLTRMSWAARRNGYEADSDLSFSYASRTMRWGGVIIALFVVYHLLDLTWGTVHPGFRRDSPYLNVVSGFRVWWISLVYIAAMVPLGLHMYHGLWSLTQTLALDLPAVKRWRRPFSAGLALVVVIGNISIPVAVLAGMVR